MIFKIPPNFLRILPSFFQNFNKYYSKLKRFLNFVVFSRQFSSPLLTFYQVFLQISQVFFFQRFTQNLNKITVEICPNFYSSYLKIFLQVSEVFLIFFVAQIVFLTKLIVSNFIRPKYYLEIEFVNKKIILLMRYPPPHPPGSFSLLFYRRSFKGPSQESLKSVHFSGLCGFSNVPSWQH